MRALLLLPPSRAMPGNAAPTLKNFKLRDDPRIVGAYSLEIVERAFGAAFEISSRRKVRTAKATGNYVDLSDAEHPRTSPAKRPNRDAPDRQSVSPRTTGARADLSTGHAQLRRVVEEAERRINSIVAEFERRLLPLAGEYPERDSSDHLSARSRALGAEPGRKMAAAEARAVLCRMADDAKDVFSSPEQALKYLESADIDAYGGSAQSLIEAGRATSVLARLDVIRFGSQG